MIFNHSEKYKNIDIRPSVAVFHIYPFLQTAIKSQYIIDIKNGEFGFKDNKRSRKLNFIDYLQRMSDDYAKSGQKACHILMESAIKRLIRYKGKAVNFSQVDKEYLIGFIDSLNHDVNEFDSKKADQNRQKKPLSDVYKEALFARVMVALNKAEREGIIIKNPGEEIDNRLKPHAKESTRCYLTLEEVKKIIDTPLLAQERCQAGIPFLLLQRSSSLGSAETDLGRNQADR